MCYNLKIETNRVLSVLEKHLKRLLKRLGKQTERDDITGFSSLPYLETNTSKLVENTKAFELTIIKELGKLTLYLCVERVPFFLINVRERKGNI